MSDAPVPSDFDAADGWSDTRGCEICPACERIYSANGGYTGPVYTTDGRRFEWIYDTDPKDDPFFCAECWPELEANRKASENRQLEDFA